MSETSIKPSESCAVVDGVSALVPPFLRPILTGSFDRRYDMRSFGEPLARLRAVPIVETGEPLVDLRDVAPSVHCHPGCLPLLRRTVAQMVALVGDSLPGGHTLTVGTALRTPSMQREIRAGFTERLEREHPDWSQATLQRALNRVIAPIDLRAPAPHTTGAALDVGVRGPDGKQLRFDYGDDHWRSAPTYYHGLDDEARNNRITLIGVMEATGLTNYLGEWWHWSYGDQGWALRVGSAVAFYDAVEVANVEELRVPKPEDPPAEAAPAAP
jgi:D-alanyl-D-alanine dipeptidase